MAVASALRIAGDDNRDSAAEALPFEGLFILAHEFSLCSRSRRDTAHAVSRSRRRFPCKAGAFPAVRGAGPGRGGTAGRATPVAPPLREEQHRDTDWLAFASWSNRTVCPHLRAAAPGGGRRLALRPVSAYFGKQNGPSPAPAADVGAVGGDLRPVGEDPGPGPRRSGRLLRPAGDSPSLRLGSDAKRAADGLSCRGRSGRVRWHQRLGSITEGR
jgi:hypothetical protein